MRSYNSNDFYKKLNRFYSNIKFYSKDVIFDYSYLNKLEKDIKVNDTYIESTFNIAIFIRDSGTYLFDFKTDKIETFELYKNNSKKVLLVQKVKKSFFRSAEYFVKIINITK